MIGLTDTKLIHSTLDTTYTLPFIIALRTSNKILLPLTARNVEPFCFSKHPKYERQSETDTSL